MNHRSVAPERKLYRPVMKWTWWLKKKSYLFFMVRELTSVFVAAFVLLYAYELFLLSKGPQVYGLFQESLRSPVFLLFYVVAFMFALFHTFTWFGVLSKVQVIRLGKWTAPPALVTASVLAGWVVVSIGVAWFFLTRH